ncbi:MAG: hypothetical protein A3A97_04405 [Candidatus Terrybacteria bacterium RIFCSPLOWO2_01_FULL_40_23]|uniref:Uncharacterized protein n=1 Tax=Candidatus Terrybacteria bacterium RIFCSPLOWO2_01_FULL_40_23 TaxID=1802366 RepID=A0A1G2PTE6_9BACT|nr:MAG: hypothetical protein A3A97_04405 [Candidatus Terrybacteria bacterium RIFCSPLOWO2_01_FULL_40_23]
MFYAIKTNRSIRPLFFAALALLFSFFVLSKQAAAYEDPAACSKSFEFETGLIPSNWRQLGGFVYNNSPAEFIGWFFTLALGIAGFLALIMIVVAGIEYTASAGNSGSQTRAKERIQNALLGLGLLIASFVILNTINTSLTNIKNPTLLAKPIGTSAQTCTCTTQGTPIPGKTTCASATYCAITQNCTYKQFYCNPGDNCSKTAQNGWYTQIYCCSFSAPPTSGGGFGGGGSGGTSCTTTATVYGCRQNPCKSGETCTPGGPGGTPLTCCLGGTCTDFTPAANYSCSPTINGDCNVGETCSFGGTGTTQCCSTGGGGAGGGF